MRSERMGGVGMRKDGRKGRRGIERVKRKGENNGNLRTVLIKIIVVIQNGIV